MHQFGMMMREPELGLIVAVARHGAIGRAGGLGWEAPEDLRHFRRVTLGHAVIIGSTTWASIGRPLPERHLIVVTSRSFAVPDGVALASDVDDALAQAYARDEHPLVAGGTSIYEQLLPRITRIHRTDIDVDVPDADAFFPDLDDASGATWDATETWPGEDPRLTFRTLVRR